VGLPSQNSNIPIGNVNANTPWGEYNQTLFVIQQTIAKMQTCTLVKISGVSNDGGLSPVGLVDVIPMVYQTDSSGQVMPHVTIYNVPYCRIQGGGNAIIIDPVVGDIGMCCFASRDISKVKSTKSPSPPGSFRKYDYSDGLYIGGMLNGTPSQYIRFHSSGIYIDSPSKIELTAPVINISASTSMTITTQLLTLNGDLTVTGTVTGQTDVISDTISGKNHVHGGVVSGSSDTTGPI
jgi:hypothetical protein